MSSFSLPEDLSNKDLLFALAEGDEQWVPRLMRLMGIPSNVRPHAAIRGAAMLIAAYQLDYFRDGVAQGVILHMHRGSLQPLYHIPKAKNKNRVPNATD